MGKVIDEMAREMVNLVHQFDDAGSHRLCDLVTKQCGEWASYRHIARLDVNGSTRYIAVSDYFQEAQQVFRVIAVSATVEQLTGTRPSGGK